MAKKNCNHCGKYKDEQEFNWRYKPLGIRHPTCRECQHGFNKAYFEGSAKERYLQQVRERKHKARQIARQFIFEYLSDHPCQVCGENDPRVLEFHHVGGKDMDISVMVAGGYSIERIKEEIARCTVLCANHHRILTVEDRGWYRSLGG